jgi:hypothetical protein
MLHTYIANIYFQVTQVCVLWKYNKDDDENGPNTRRCRPVNIFNTVGGGLLDGPDSLNPVKAEEWQKRGKMFSTLSLRGYPQSNNRHPPRNSCPQHTHTHKTFAGHIYFFFFSSFSAELGNEVLFFIFYFFFKWICLSSQSSPVLFYIRSSSAQLFFFFVDIVVRLVTEREREREKDKLFVEPHTLTAYFCAVCCRH